MTLKEKYVDGQLQQCAVFSDFEASQTWRLWNAGSIHFASSRREGSQTRTPKDRSEGKRQQLEKKLVASQLANELAHGINNPLEALTNLIYLLQQSVLMAEDRQRVEEADRQLGRITTLVRGQNVRQKVFHRAGSRSWHNRLAISPQRLSVTNRTQFCK